MTTRLSHCDKCPDTDNGCDECGSTPDPCLCELRYMTGCHDLGMLSLSEVQSMFERYEIESIRIRRAGLRKWWVLVNNNDSIGATWNDASTLEEALVLAVHRVAASRGRGEQ